MTYLVFARKFRPQQFDDVMGQEPIVTTLKNAIKQERIPQSFLFSGPRGCGKTSTARILAKALNCAKGPAANPCGKCPACLEITQSNSMDVLEIDGASNRGIDEIRNLRENVKFKPVTGRYRIYIIDEVHMLTTEAFNALLKTLEEPPPHVKFVFATTEPHKVPLTILSRCHRFHFKRITTALIAEKLTEIAKAEKLKFEKNALFEIAKASDGSLRDAESLLDQLASFSDKTIKEEDVLVALGLASEEVFFGVLDALKSRDAAKLFSMAADLYDNGRDLVQFARGLHEIFRHLLLFQCTDKADEFVEMSPEGLTALKKRKNDFSRGELLLGLSLLGNLQNQLRRNLAPPRLLVETALLKLMHVDGLKDVGELLSGAPQAAVPSPQQRTFPSSGNKSSLSSPNVSVGDLATPDSRQKHAGMTKAAEPRRESKASAVMEESGPAPSLDGVESVWPRVIEYVKTKRMSVGLFLAESEPIEVTETNVTLGLPVEFQFHREMLDKDVNKRLVEEAFQVVGGRKLRVQFVVTRPEKSETTARPAGKGKAGAEPTSDTPVDAEGLPSIINEALQIFDGAKIIRKE